VTIARRAGRTVLKVATESPAGATREELTTRVDRQHAGVELEFGERAGSAVPVAARVAEPAAEQFDALFEAGFAAYRARDYEGALGSRAEAERLRPDDRVLGG
jgi:hypothetical protein